ncbi:MAG: hypothetical protein ABSH06_25630, partial [Thermodesulfobacteriota bacterium]
ARSCRKLLRFARFHLARFERMPFIPRFKSLGFSGITYKYVFYKRYCLGLQIGTIALRLEGKIGLHFDIWPNLGLDKGARNELVVAPANSKEARCVKKLFQPPPHHFD